MAATEANCIRAIGHYVNKMLKPKDKTKEIPGMKCLLLDKETKTIVSMVHSMNEILSKEVFLIENLDAKTEAGTSHLKAVCLIRPTQDNVRALLVHLREPKFTEYHIFFTSIVAHDILRKLADADASGVIKQIQEYYADFYPVNTEAFTMNLAGALSLSRPRSSYGHPEENMFRRSVQGLLSLLLAFKVKPYVRYSASSEAARAVASEIMGTMGGERELFTFNRGASGAPLLMIVDRREDPVTPLLLPWTYQAMIHEYLPGGIRNHTVDMRHVRGMSADLKELVIAPTQDAMFRDLMFSNYGDFNALIQAKTTELAASKSSVEKPKTFAEMQAFMDKYPDLKAKGLVVSKHVSLANEIATSVGKRSLFDVSELEQNIVSSDNPNDHFRDICAFIQNCGPDVNQEDALRLLMLYSLRYERTKADKVGELRRFYAERLGMPEGLRLLDTVMAYGGATARGSSDLLFGGVSGSGMLSKLTSNVRRNLQGVENVFTQHQSGMVTMLDQIAKGKLSRTAFPAVGAEVPPGTKLSTVIVFFVGGCTYYEACKAAEINTGSTQLGAVAPGGGSSSASGAGAPSATYGAGGAAGAAPFRVVVGGTSILSTTGFLAELKRLGDDSVSIDVPSSSSSRSAAGGPAGSGVGF